MGLKVFNVKKQPITYKYRKIGEFNLQFSNNISSVCFTGTASNGSIERQLARIVRIDDNIKELSDYAFYKCNMLVDVDLSNAAELSAFRSNCFKECVNLSTITLPNQTKEIDSNCFSSCRNLKNFQFPGYSYDVDQEQSPQLTTIQDCVFEGCTNLKSIAFPKSIDNISKVNNECLKNSSISRIVFLNNSNVNSLTATKCFGLNSDCTVYTTSQQNVDAAADAMYIYSKSSNTLVKNNDYTIYMKAASEATAGRIRLRKVNIFRENVVKWCVDPSVRQPTDRVKATDKCPIIVIYLDILTSSISYDFFTNVLQSSDLSKKLKQKLNCYVFLLLRNGNIDCTSSDLRYYKTALNAGKTVEKDFVVVNFYYDTKFNSVSTSNTNVDEFVDLLADYAQKTDFNNFNYEPFDIKLEEPYVEIIPTSGSQDTQSGFVPWWYSNGNITSIPDWSV